MKIGEGIDNKCSKCGDGAHVIIGITNGRIVKVECKQCSLQHRHRLTDAAKAKPRTRAGAKPAARIRATSLTVEPDLSQPIRPYATSESYSPGDRIEHKIFGVGTVECVITPSKIQVFFDEGPKTMVQGRTP